jgi:hypothetical protein
MKSIRAFAAALVLAAPLASNASILVNGSFEQPGLSSGWTILSGMPGWQASAAGVEIRRNAAGTAQDGFIFVELDTTVNSAIWQDVSTQGGHDYVLSGYYSPRMGVALASNDVEVLWNGSRLTTLTGSGAGLSDHAWRQFSFTVRGTGSDQLRFAAAGTSDSLGGSLDNITLMAVPEPGSLALVLAALGAVGLAARRQKR